MILCLSTSSPEVSLAVFDGQSFTLTVSQPGGRNASAVVCKLLHEHQIDLNSFDGFLVDVGPGSFSGVKVGVTMIKTWAWTTGKPVFTLTSFDLVDQDITVALASKRGEVYMRVPGQEPFTAPVSDVPSETPGNWIDQDRPRPLQNPTFHPLVASQIPLRHPQNPLEITPFYVAQPSISQPKQHHIMGETFRNA